MRKKYTTIFLLILFLTNTILTVPSFAGHDSSEKKINSNVKNTPTIRAVSLKALQQQLKTGDQPENNTNDLKQFAGLKEVMGYMMDEANSDLIIFGKTNPKLAPIFLEDFIVALRNSYFKYAPLQDNIYQYSFPGCSIDPDPKIIQQLQLIGDKISNSDSLEEIEKEIKAWHSTCNNNQNVRVMGIPFDTRFAKVIVKADYDMKRLVDGSDSLDIPGFNSLIEERFDKIRQAVINEKPVFISPASMNRFWFYPGEYSYEEDDGIVKIKQCPVILLTEQMFIKASGGLASGNRADPLAQHFAESFSRVYDKIADKRPIYTELQNLFRFVALAKIIKFKSAEKTSAIDFDYFLEEFIIDTTPVAKTLPGLSEVKEFYHKKELKDSYQVVQLWLPSCGGVRMGIDLKPEHVKKNRDGSLAKLKAKILKTRPSQQAVKWDVPEKLEKILFDKK